MATIQDVAREAGVSTATVSRVFSAPELVLEPTRQKVMEAVHRLGYEPNFAAKSLRTLRTEKILVTVPDISNPFFSQVIRGVEEAALAAGYSVLLGDTRHEEAREEQYALMFRRKEADGLIFLGHRLPDILAELLAAKGPRTPIVNGCEFRPGLAVSSAHIDNERAAAEVMDHLYGLGHVRVGVVTGPLASPISRLGWSPSTGVTTTPASRASRASPGPTTLSASFETSATWRLASIASRLWRVAASGLPVASARSWKGRAMTVSSRPAATQRPASQAARASAGVSQSAMSCLS